jgi:hypothetical protein
MRAQRILWGSVGSLLAVAALAYCCGSYGNAKTPVKLSRPAQSALVRDGQLYAVNDLGELLVLAKTSDPVKSFGKFEGNLLDISGNKACFAFKNLLYVADLSKRTIIASHILDTPNAKVCFIGADQLAIPKSGSVQIFNVTTAKTIRTIDLRENDKTVRAITCRADGDRLYVATAGAKSALVVIDVKKSEIVDQIPLKMSFGSQEFQIHDNKALLLSHYHIGYGAWGYQASFVDLKTRQVTEVKLPADIAPCFGAAPMSASVMVGPRDRLCLVGATSVYACDAQGKLVGPALAKTPGRILTVWNRHAVIAGKESLDFVPLSATTARSE